MPNSLTSGLYGSHRRILLIVFLVVMLVCSLFVYRFLIVDNDIVIDYAGLIHVKTEVNLVAVVNGVPPGVPVVIVIDKNIQLTDELRISKNANITLTSANKAVSLNMKNPILNSGGVISVETGGWLTIDGNIIVTNGQHGVFIDRDGTFIMINGTISGNAGKDGGGVYNFGIFVMSGGKILDNLARNGGGVCNNGNFTMSGGEISGNFAHTVYGGGVFNYGNFTMSGGVITANRAEGGGGGVYNNHGSLYISGGEISSNERFHGGILQWIEDNIDDVSDTR